jgi:exosortase B
MLSALEQKILPGRELAGLLGWLAVILGLAALYVPTYVGLARGLWMEEAHAHGPLVVAIAAWLAWRQRAALAAAPSAGATAAGGALLALGLALYVVGRSLAIALFEVGSHLPVLAGGVLVLAGWRALARLWFPLVFLAFAVPLPGFVVEALSGPLKSLVSQLAAAILYEAGYPVARSGVMLAVAQYQMLVADACSGLNSLYSLAALGLLYVHLTAPRSVARAACLLAAVVPFALTANLVRVLLLILVTFHLGEAAGQSFLHGSAGITLFAVALALLLGFDALLQRLPALRAGGAAA